MQYHSKAKLEGAGAPLSHIYLFSSSSLPSYYSMLLPYLLPLSPLLSPFLLFYSTLHINLVSPSFQEQNKLRVYIECYITLLLFLSTCVLCTPPILPVVLYSDGLLFLPAISNQFFKSLFPSSICDFQLIFPQLLLAPTITTHPLLSTPKSRRYLYAAFSLHFSTPLPLPKKPSLPSYSRGGE